MRVLNAGLSSVTLQYNAIQSHNPKLGCWMILSPGQEADVPEEARAVIEDPLAGPGLQGVVILEYGAEKQAARIRGLQQQLNYVEQIIAHHEERHESLRMVGRTIFHQTPKEKAHRELAKQIKLAIKAVESELAHGDFAPVADARPGQPGRRRGRPAAAVVVVEDQRVD